MIFTASEQIVTQNGKYPWTGKKKQESKRMKTADTTQVNTVWMMDVTHTHTTTSVHLECHHQPEHLRDRQAA